jgi:hypothetical protein
MIVIAVVVWTWLWAAHHGQLPLHAQNTVQESRTLARRVMKMRNEKKKLVGRALQVRGQVVGDRAAAAHPKELAICPFLSPIRQRIGWVRGQRCGELVGVNKRMVGQQVVQEGSAVEKKGDKW